jgi:GTP-binding protein
MIDEYLSQRTNLKLAIQLLDIRRKPNRDDMDMINYFKHNDIQILYVLTKIDKTNQKETNLGLKTICNTLNIKKDELVLTSSLNRTGLDNLKKSIKHIIKNQ